MVYLLSFTTEGSWEQVGDKIKVVPGFKPTFEGACRIFESLGPALMAMQTQFNCHNVFQSRNSGVQACVFFRGLREEELLAGLAKINISEIPKNLKQKALPHPYAEVTNYSGYLLRDHHIFAGLGVLLERRMSYRQLHLIKAERTQGHMGQLTMRTPGHEAMEP